MYRRSHILWMALSLILVLTPAKASFLNNDTSGITNLVNFDQLAGHGPWGATLTDTMVNVYASGDFTINMNVPNYSEHASGMVRYGRDTLINSADFTTPGALTDPYLVSNATPDDAAWSNGLGMQALEFTLAGGAVSRIGIRLTPVAGLPLSDIQIHAFNAAGEMLDFFFITSASTPSKSTLTAANSNNDASDGGFYGIASASSDIVRFRIIGGYLAFDDLGFGGLQLAGGGGEDPGGSGDPSEADVPEPTTFLLCGSALALVALAGRRRKAAAK